MICVVVCGHSTAGPYVCTQSKATFSQHGYMHSYSQADRPYGTEVGLRQLRFNQQTVSLHGSVGRSGAGLEEKWVCWFLKHQFYIYSLITTFFSDSLLLCLCCRFYFFPVFHSTFAWKSILRFCTVIVIIVVNHLEFGTYIFHLKPVISEAIHIVVLFIVPFISSICNKYIHKIKNTNK